MNRAKNKLFKAFSFFGLVYIFGMWLRSSAAELLDRLCAILQK